MSTTIAYRAASWLALARSLRRLFQRSQRSPGHEKARCFRRESHAERQMATFHTDSQLPVVSDSKRRSNPQACNQDVGTSSLDASAFLRSTSPTASVLAWPWPTWFSWLPFCFCLSGITLKRKLIAVPSVICCGAIIPSLESALKLIPQSTCKTRRRSR